jgi:hypothetical protein
MTLLENTETQALLQRLREIVQAETDLKTNLLYVRQLLEAIYKALSADSKTSFSGLFARIQYVNSILKVPKDLGQQVNQIRILCNKAAHEDDFIPRVESFTSSIHALYALLKWLNPEQCDPEIELYLNNTNAKPFPSFKPSKKLSFGCVVTSWKLLRKEGVNCGIQLKVSTEEGMEYDVILNDRAEPGRRWSLLSKSLWKYCSLNCIDLSEVRGRQDQLQSNPSTMVILEPDFLLDATAIASCFTQEDSHPELFIVKQLFREASKSSIAQGTMLNNILDELIIDPNQEYEQLFRSGLARQAIQMVSLGETSALEIYNNIRINHLPQIQEFAKMVQANPLQLEPSFINPDYGLQGRLDILWFLKGIPHIVELKSGKAPRFDVYKEHQMQVIAYNMIIRNCFDNSSRGTSGIFYSAAEENKLRSVSNTIQLEQELLLCRNRIVGIMHRLAEDPSIYFNWLPTADTTAYPPYIVDSIKLIVSTLKSLEDYEREWFLEQCRLAVREIWQVKIGGLSSESVYGHNALWKMGAEQKRQRYRLLSPLEVDSADFNVIRFVTPKDDYISNFRVGDVVVLYKNNLPIQKQQIIRGQISDFNDDTVEVSIRGGLRLPPEHLHECTWSLEHDIMEASLYSPLSSLFSFLQSLPSTRELWLGLREPQTDKNLEKPDENLDSTVDRLCASREYHIVQGPPGTGKTSGLLKKYIARQYQFNDDRILILSFTNRAVDEICGCLKKADIPYIRTGNSQEVDEELLGNIISGKDYRQIHAILRDNRIWVATVSSCAGWLPDMLRLVSFDQLIVDEASQIVENSILGIVSKVKKTILIGDQNQLPPITAMSDHGFRFSHPRLKDLCYDNYSQSLLERLTRVCTRNGWQHANSMLRHHFRMHEDIAALIQHYYQGRLISSLPQQKEILPPHSNVLLASRVIWIDCPRTTTPYYDAFQVKLVCHLLDLFQKEAIIQDYSTDIGIVAPYRAMIHAIFQELKEKQKAITVDTVERFQGSERKNMILTLPIHDNSSLSSLMSLSPDGSVDRKLNVALSRAQERLLILGNREMCLGSQHFAFLLDKIQAAGNIIPAKQIIPE